MKKQINGVMLEYDILELEQAEKFRDENEKVVKRAEELNGNVDLVGLIKGQCSIIFDYVDALFGKGTHNKLFGDKTNLRTCLQVQTEINEAILEDTKPFQADMMPSSKAKK